jgi:hypothetical protein
MTTPSADYAIWVLHVHTAVHRLFVWLLICYLETMASHCVTWGIWPANFLVLAFDQLNYFQVLSLLCRAPSNTALSVRPSRVRV